MGSTSRSRRGNRRNLISLTPLIDVVFILLVFFMLASSFLDWRAITLNAAADALTEPAGDSGLQGSVLVDIGPDGDLRLSGQAMSRDAVLAEVLALRERRPETGVILRPAPGVPVQMLVDLIDLMTARDIAAISVQRGS